MASSDATQWRSGARSEIARNACSPTSIARCRSWSCLDRLKRVLKAKPIHDKERARRSLTAS